MIPRDLVIYFPQHCFFSLLLVVVQLILGKTLRISAINLLYNRTQHRTVYLLSLLVCIISSRDCRFLGKGRWCRETAQRAEIKSKHLFSSDFIHHSEM